MGSLILTERTLSSLPPPLNGKISVWARNETSHDRAENRVGLVPCIDPLTSAELLQA